MNKAMLTNKLTKCSILIAGIIFYSYYGIYKMIFVHLDQVGGDFMHGYYAAHNYINGSPLYVMPAHWTPYFYPPISTLVFIPFTFLSPQKAVLCWLMITHLMVLTSIYFTYRFHSSDNKLDSATATAVAFGFSFPLYENILTGNLNIIIFLFITLIYYLLFSQKKHIIPLLLAICTFIKTYPAIFMSEYLRNKNWKAILHFLLTISIIGIISLGIFGIETHAAFIHKLPELNQYIGIFTCASFTYFIKLLLPKYDGAIYATLSMLFSIILLTLWWIRSSRYDGLASRENSRITLVNFFIMTSILIISLPSSWLFYHAFYVVPFYFIIYSRLQQVIRYRHFIVFIIFFVLINFWEPIMYHVPVSLDGLTIKTIGDNKNGYPLLYPIFYSIPFILNVMFFFWLFLNYDNIAKAIHD